MAVGLFVNKKDLKRYTIIDGNLDENVYLPMIEIAQETHIQSLLGSDLYRKIEGDIASSSLSGNYLTLVNSFLNKATIFYALTDLVVISGYDLSNNGLGRRTSENKDQVTENEVDILQRKYRDWAEHYANLAIKHICNNISNFPEYNTNDSEDIYPANKAYSTNWEI